MSGSNGQATGLQPARPTINLAGQDAPPLAQGLIELLIHENTLGLYRCEARFGNWGPKNGSTGFLYFGRDRLEFGKPLKIKLGADTLFDGKITAIEAHFPEGKAPEIAVLAEDRLQDLRMTRRTRQFADVADADAIKTIASDHGLTPDLNLSGPTHKTIAQVNQSDLAFVRERARAVGGEIWVEGATLFGRARTGRTGGGSPPKALAYGNELREFTVLADLATQRTAVSVNGWDVSGKAAITHQATDSVVGGELDGGNSGSSILKQAFGERKDALAHTVPLTKAQAQAEAEALFRHAARRFVVGHGVAQTSGKLRVGAVVELKGLGPLFSRKYYLSEVKHLFDGASGLRTEFTAECPGLGNP